MIVIDKILLCNEQLYTKTTTITWTKDEAKIKYIDVDNNWSSDFIEYDLTKIFWG